MKNHVVAMEDEMKSLAKNMEEINDCSSIINKNLAEKREKIDKLSSVNRMLKKVRCCFFFVGRFSKFFNFVVPILFAILCFLRYHIDAIFA